MNGRGAVEPNPMVGCVIVSPDGRVIGEGWHERFGGPHAEPTALAACAAAGHSPAGATAYVTLEPCCHTNKKTPPCAPRLIEAGIRRVVVACLDPNPDVDGNGVAMLEAGGVVIDGPVLEGEAKQLIAPFLGRVVHQRPYVTLKWAESADGKVAGPGGRRAQISNPASTRLVHELRGRCDAILVGIRTALADDPLLTARGVREPRPLTRAVVDPNLRLPADSQLVATADQSPVVVYCGDEAYEIRRDRREALLAAGVDVVPLSVFPAGLIHMSHLVEEMGRRRATHLLVEGGPTIHRQFMDAGLADRVWVFRSPGRIGDETAPAAAPVPADFVVTGEFDLDGDRLTEYLDPRSHLYFGPYPSADLVLAR